MLKKISQILKKARMESSEGVADWSLFPKIFFGLVTVSIVAIASWSLSVDPYWAFKVKPPWLDVTKGGNRLLDTEDRRAKPLQFLVRQVPDVVVIGSSVVYRGIDPQDMAIPRGFNFGMSTLMSYELPVLARLIKMRSQPATVIIGLDYFAFTNFPMHVQVNPALSTYAGRINLLVSSVLSWRSLRGTGSEFIKSTYEPGGWKSNGFRETPDRNSGYTVPNDRAQFENLLPFNPALVANLEQALGELRDRRVIVYLSPLSGAQRRLFDRKGLTGDLTRWRQAMALVSRSNSVEFHDLTDMSEFDDFEPNKGSSQYWYDNLHFKPAVGRLVLEKIGVAKPVL